MNTRTYTEEFIEQVKDLAVIGLLPVQIAERLNLAGEERRDFLFHINSKHHPLHTAFLESQAHYEGDVLGAIQNMAAGGDTMAQMTWAQLYRQRNTDKLKKELFDI